MYGKNDDDLWDVTATYFGTDPTLCVTNKKREGMRIERGHNWGTMGILNGDKMIDWAY